MPGDRVFDRSAEDLGNIIGLEHVNVKIPDQIVATNFYVTALGLTRDPYIMTGTENMWINAGQQQFHMPTGKPEVLRGTIGFVVPDLESLKMRLTNSREKLGGTKFMCAADDKYVSVTCPRAGVRRHDPRHPVRGVQRAAQHRRRDREVLSGRDGAPATVTFNGNT